MNILPRVSDFNFHTEPPVILANLAVGPWLHFGRKRIVKWGWAA